MISLDNPFTVRGTLDRCWLFTYQTPIAAARRLLPSPLEPVTHGGCAFWNVVVCHIHLMRPWPLPPIAGLAYWHVAYRLYAKYRQPNGETIEGLYFLRSDCDSSLIATTGNWLTNFNFHRAQIDVSENRGRVTCRVESADAPALAILVRETPASRPDYSAFADLEEAAAFLKYQPRGLSVNRGRVSVVAIKRDEGAWKSRLVTVKEARWKFLEAEEVRPEVCFEVEPIAYQWNRGACASS